MSCASDRLHPSTPASVIPLRTREAIEAEVRRRVAEERARLQTRVATRRSLDLLHALKGAKWFVVPTLFAALDDTSLEREESKKLVTLTDLQREQRLRVLMSETEGLLK